MIVEAVNFKETPASAEVPPVGATVGAGAGAVPDATGTRPLAPDTGSTGSAPTAALKLEKNKDNEKGLAALAQLSNLKLEKEPQIKKEVSEASKKKDSTTDSTAAPTALEVQGD